MRFLFIWIMALLSIGASAHAQSCNQSFQIDPSRTVPAFPDALDTGVYGGMQCGALEQYRVDIYVDNLLGIPDSDFADLARWQAARQLYLTKISNAEQRLADAQNSAEIQAAVTVALHYTGYGLTLAGCNPSAVTGIPAIACVGGFLAAQGGTLWSFATMGSDKKHAQAALNDVRDMLEAHDTLSAADLNASIATFHSEFENACFIVKEYCLH